MARVDAQPRIRTGAWGHRVQVQAPTPPVALPGGGWAEGWAALDPPLWDCAIDPATARSLESIGAGTVLAQATHVLHGWYHPGLTTKCRVIATVDGAAHVMNVLFVANRRLENTETDLVCAEVVE